METYIAYISKCSLVILNQIIFIPVHEALQQLPPLKIHAV